MTTLTELLQQQAEIEAKIKAAKDDALANVDKHRSHVAEYLATHGLTIAEVFGAQGAKIAKAAGLRPKAAGKTEPKFRDPETGATYGGKGPRPKWFSRAVPIVANGAAA